MLRCSSDNARGRRDCGGWKGMPRFRTPSGQVSNAWPAGRGLALTMAAETVAVVVTMMAMCCICGTGCGSGDHHGRGGSGCSGRDGGSHDGDRRCSHCGGGCRGGGNRDGGSSDSSNHGTHNRGDEGRSGRGPGRSALEKNLPGFAAGW